MMQRASPQVQCKFSMAEINNLYKFPKGTWFQLLTAIKKINWTNTLFLAIRSVTRAARRKLSAQHASGFFTNVIVSVRQRRTALMLYY